MSLRKNTYFIFTRLIALLLLHVFIWISFTVAFHEHDSHHHVVNRNVDQQDEEMSEYHSSCKICYYAYHQQTESYFTFFEFPRPITIQLVNHLNMMGKVKYNNTSELLPNKRGPPLFQI